MEHTSHVLDRLHASRAPVACPSFAAWKCYSNATTAQPTLIADQLTKLYNAALKQVGSLTPSRAVPLTTISESPGSFSGINFLGHGCRLSANPPPGKCV